MFFIPGFLIALLTFPGVIVHELAHLICCLLGKVEVQQVCLFRLGTPSGYVIHETPRSAYWHILIVLGPFFLNTLAGALIAVPVVVPHSNIAEGSPTYYLLFWLAISIAMHAFPSTGDAKSLWHGLWGQRAPLIARLIGTPLVGIIYVGAIGSMLWLDVVYGVLVVLMLPKIIVGLVR